MLGNWVSKTLGKTQAVEDLSGVNHEMASLLILGRNSFGDEIYTYMSLPMQRIDEVKARLSTNVPFVPSHYGNVMAAGRGLPSEDMREEMGTPDFMLYFEREEAPSKIGAKPAGSGGYG